MSQADQVRRAPTRLLTVADYFRNGIVECARPLVDAAAPPDALAESARPYGWLTIVKGPGRGKSFALTKFYVSIGRALDQDVVLDFGDDHISRRGHLSLHYCSKGRAAKVVDGEKTNPVYLNGGILAGARRLWHRDRISVGRTTLRFVLNA